MKKLIFFTSFLAAFLVRLPRAAEFGYPASGEPWYFIKLQFSDSGGLAKGPWRVTRVEVDGARSRDFLLFQNGTEVLGKDISGGLPFEIKIRYPWQGDKKCRIQVELENPRTKKTVNLTQEASSPPLRGYWNSDWKNYLALLVAEENGIPRRSYPLRATVGVLANYISSPDEIRVVKAEKEGDDVRYTEVPSQVYDLITWADPKILSAQEKEERPGERIIRCQPTTSFSLAFPADLRPHEKASYLVFYNHPSAPKPVYPSDLKVAGAGLGKVIENAYFKAILNKKSGVLYEITEKTSRTRLEHKLETNGSLHWNPCVYSPPHTWTHTSDWENPSFAEVTGPVFFSIRLTAPLPHYPQVLASVTYRFCANTPYILVETTVEIRENMFVQALRNGEIVFNKAVFKKVGYKTIGGGVETIELGRTRMHPDHVATLRPDVPWVTFYNEEKGIAFANLYLNLAMTNVEGGEASAQQPFVYIQHGPWYYLARGLVYSFGTNNQTRMLPVRKGSLYHESNAFYPFAFKKEQGYAAQVEELFAMLKYPLSVRESIETYPESPEGWVVPILTEPFEEGVEQAIGGKKKK